MSVARGSNKSRIHLLLVVSLLFFFGCSVKFREAAKESDLRSVQGMATGVSDRDRAIVSTVQNGQVDYTFETHFVPGVTGMASGQ